MTRPTESTRSATRTPRARRWGRRAAVVAGLGALAAVPGATFAAVNPPHTVVSLPSDEGVGIEGYSPAQGPLTIDVLRGSLRIGTTGPLTVPADGIIEVNHPVEIGEVPTCWIAWNPDIVDGDTVRVSQGGVTETSQVRNITVAAPVDGAPGSVEVHGTAQNPDGTPFNPFGIDVRLISPALQGISGGGPFIQTSTFPGATIGYDAGVGNVNWTAIFPGLSPQNVLAAKAAATEAEWFSDDLTEATAFPAPGGPPEPAACPGVPDGAYVTTQTAPSVFRPESSSLVVRGAAADDATEVSVTLSDTDLGTPDITVTAPVADIPGVGGRVWEVTFPEQVDATPGVVDGVDDLTDGVLTATPTFNQTTTPIPGIGRTVVKNATGPVTQITGGPAAGSTDTSLNSAATFTFTSTALDVSFECRLTGVLPTFTPCTSPRAFTFLPNGGYTFDVRAVDPALPGSPGPTASRTWTIARPTPVTQISGPPAFNPSTSATFGFTADPPAASFQCRLDGGAITTCTPPHTRTSLAQGGHTLEARGVDSAGNVGAFASYNWTVDTVAPTTTIVTRPPDDLNDSTATFTMTTNEAGATFECSLDNGPFTACTSPHSYVDLTDGAHNVRIRARDQAGNAGVHQTDTFVVNGPPSTFFTQAPNPSTAATSATFAFGSNDPAATFECSLDGAPFAFCATPRTIVGLSLGSHTFRVRAVDAGDLRDLTPATFAWDIVLLDTEAPTLTARILGALNPTMARNGILITTNRCNERCVVQVRARVIVPSPLRGGKTRIFRLTSTKVLTPVGVTSRARVTLNGIQLAAVRRSLRAGKRVRVLLTVVATDTAGNSTVRIPGITLVRRNL